LHYHYQDKESLYLAGGYGENSAGQLVTYPVISSVNLSALIDGVIHGKDTFSGSPQEFVRSGILRGFLDLLKSDVFGVGGGHALCFE